MKGTIVSQQIIILNYFQSLVEAEVNKVNILLPFPLSLATAPPLTTGCIKVMLKRKPKRQKTKKSTQRLSVGYACFLHNAVCSSVSLHAEKPLVGSALWFSLQRFESSQIDSSLLWSECIIPFSQWDKQRSTTQGLRVRINKPAGRGYSTIQQDTA